MPTQRNSARILVLIALALILLAGFIIIKRVAATVISTTYNHVIIGNHYISTILLDTPALRESGLSGRKSLDSDKGALFVYESPDKHSIWMKDMNFAIDVLWLDKNGKVIHIVDDMLPKSYPNSFRPASPALYVLELPSDAISRFDISYGVTVTNLPPVD